MSMIFPSGIFPLFKLPEFVYRDLTVILIGALCHWMLYGILLAQVGLYYIAFPNDYRLLRLTVLLELVFETIQTAGVTQVLFRAFTRGFRDVLLVNEVSTLWFSVPLMTGFIAGLTQVFYCYRTAVLTKSKSAVALVSVLSLAQFGSATAVALQTRQAQFLTNILGTKISLVTVGIWGASGVGCDTTIAVIMVYYLKKRDTGFQETHNMVKRLIRLTIETGLVTAVFSIITLALAYIPGHPPYYQIAILILAKTYSNSMIAALNSRIKVVANAELINAPPCWNEEVVKVEAADECGRRLRQHGTMRFVRPGVQSTSCSEDSV